MIQAISRPPGQVSNTLYRQLFRLSVFCCIKTAAGSIAVVCCGVLCALHCVGAIPPHCCACIHALPCICHVTVLYCSRELRELLIQGISRPLGQVSIVLHLYLRMCCGFAFCCAVDPRFALSVQDCQRKRRCCVLCCRMPCNVLPTYWCCACSNMLPRTCYVVRRRCCVLIKELRELLIQGISRLPGQVSIKHL